jgi:hypothetical protein
MDPGKIELLKRYRSKREIDPNDLASIRQLSLLGYMCTNLSNAGENDPLVARTAGFGLSFCGDN